MCMTPCSGWATHTCLSAYGRTPSNTVSARVQHPPWYSDQPSQGMGWDEVAEDPNLGGKRTRLINEAAKRLADARMIAFDREYGNFVITDLGRIAAKYYIRCNSIEIFNKELKPKMTEADVLAVLCMSTEVTRIPYGG